MESHINIQVKFLLENLSQKLRRGKALEKLVELYAAYSLFPIIGAEIEFYYPGCYDLKNIDKYLVKKEKGNCQYEINISPNSPLNVIAEILNCFAFLKDMELGPKPFEHDYGNALQLHINFLKKDYNLFEDKEILSLCGDILCESMLSSFLIFAPTEECYKRFDKNFMSPTNVSKGSNNRTTALRIPPVGPKRIEYRVGAYPADPYLMTYVILSQLKTVLIENKRPKKYEIIYGNAFDEQYRLTKFPQNIIEAERLFCYNQFNLE